MLSLKDREWNEYKISDIFDISPGKRLTKSDMLPGDKPFIGATDSNNGITAYVSNTNVSEDRNVLGVNYNGSVVENFYHPYTCIFSDDVKRFRLKEIEGNKYIYLFMKTAILQQKSKYAYGYKFNEQRMQKQLLLLPSNEQGKPDYDYMEQFIKERERQIVQNYIDIIGSIVQTGGGITQPNEKEWKEFYINEVFTHIQRGRRLKTADHTPGNIPYVSSSAINNGVDDFVGNNYGVRIFDDCLTLANSGSVGTTFYHGYPFVASDHVTALKSDEMNEYSYLFVIAIISRFSEKYSFNREISDTRINKEKIILPVKDDGTPDYEYMAAYVESIINQLKLRYLNEKKAMTA